MSGSPNPALPALYPLTLILVAVAPAVWSVAGLVLGLTLLFRGILVLALSAPLSLVLATFVLGCRSWSDWGSGNGEWKRGHS